MKRFYINSSIWFFVVITTLTAQTGIKWEESFNSDNMPINWSLIDVDESGEAFALVQSSTTMAGTEIIPQAGQSFWVSGAQNSNRAGVIDEWLISPRISVIYEGDSLYFWAGSIGGPFNDSIKVKVSTTNSAIESFQYELGYFKVDGPAGSWHKYGFDLSEFDSMDIYFAINYYILDGGPGGANSDYVWIDHATITGDPSTINSAPSFSSLQFPANESYVNPESDSIEFKWTASQDLDDQNLKYKLSIVNVFPKMEFIGLTDTVFSLKWKELLNEYTQYRWTIEVSDGKSSVAAVDTFAFIVGTPTDISDYTSNLPDNYELNQNYPNPFNPTTIINFSIPKNEFVSLKVYDILGNEVKVLVNEEKSPGYYETLLNATGLSSGIYFYRIQAGDFVESKKMLLLK